jgi:hypothetical protein
VDEKKDEVLLSVSHLAIGKLKGDFKHTEVCKRVWTAFELGIKYEQLIYEEERTGRKEPT